MQQPEQYYRGKLEELAILLKENKRKRNGITLLKILLFLAAIFFIYTFSTSGTVAYLCAFFGAVASFILVNIFETRLLKKIAFLNELKKCSEVELEYLSSDLQHLLPGNEYKDQAHPCLLYTSVTHHSGKWNPARSSPRQSDYVPRKLTGHSTTNRRLSWR